jgi:hypothetical protein
LAKGWPVQIGPRQFDLCNTGHPDIVAQEFSGQWEFPEPRQKRAAPAQLDEIETAAFDADISDERTVDRILLAMRVDRQSAFKYSRGDMLIQFGWISHALKHDDKPTTEVELKELKRKGRSVSY